MVAPRPSLKPICNQFILISTLDVTRASHTLGLANDDASILSAMQLLLDIPHCKPNFRPHINHGVTMLVSKYGG